MSSLAEHRSGIADGRFLRVLNYHNTPPSSAAALRRELGRYARHYRSITVADLDAWFATNRWPDDRPPFVPVFYEGYRNGFDVAAPVLDELGLTGWFAVCTGFVDCPPAEQEVFARAHWIELVEEELGGERLAMTWDEVRRLSARHVVVAHTASHAGIAEVGSAADVQREVLEPAAKLAAATGAPTAAFAWLWGTPWGASTAHDAAVRAAGYRYLISNTMIHRIT